MPCGGSPQSPPGLLTISATIGTIDGSGDDEGNTLGNAAPTRIWSDCQTVSYMGDMLFDIVDIGMLEEQGRLETLVVHEMGHAIGVG